MADERERIRFIIQRDGLPVAIEFAQRTIKMYRTSVMRSRKRGYDKPHFASLPEYRRGFIESYLICKGFLRAHAPQTGIEVAKPTK